MSLRGLVAALSRPGVPALSAAGWGRALGLRVLVLTLASACGPLRAVYGDLDQDGYAAPEDCDDGDASVHPGASDTLGNGVDENCDGVDGDAGPVLTDSDTAVVDTDPVVSNRPPQSPRCRVTPGVARVATPLEVVFDQPPSDPEGDPVTVAYQWQVLDGPTWQDLPGETSATLAACTVRNPATDPALRCFRGSQLRVRCTANDGVQDGLPLVSDAVTLVNTPPVVTTVTLAPTNPTTFDNLLASASGTDDDGDALAFQFAWRKNGALLAGQTASLLSSSRFGRGDVVVVEVVAEDGEGDVSALASEQVVIANSPPGVPTCSITPMEPDVTTPLQAVVAVVPPDVDGDVVSVQFQWQQLLFPAWVDLSGETVEVLSSCLDRAPSLPPGQQCVRGNQLRVVCTATDGVSLGAPGLSGAVTIGNAPPSVVRVQILPDPATDIDDLTVQVQLSDPDLDVVTPRVAWSVDGVPLPGQTGFTLGHLNSEALDTVSVEVVGEDALGATSAPQSASTVIQPLVP